MIQIIMPSDLFCYFISFQYLGHHPINWFHGMLTPILTFNLKNTSDLLEFLHSDVL